MSSPALTPHTVPSPTTDTCSSAPPTRFHIDQPICARLHGHSESTFWFMRQGTGVLVQLTQFRLGVFASPLPAQLHEPNSSAAPKMWQLSCANTWLKAA